MAWRHPIEQSIVAFEAELEGRGFRRNGELQWQGTIPIPGPPGIHPAKPHTITLPPSFPFDPPAVQPDPPPSGPHWHMEHDGSLCLWPRGEDTGRPWEHVDGLLEKVADWYRQSEAGWPEDPGDLDLERYFEERSWSELVAYDDLDKLMGRRLRVRRGGHGVRLVEPGPLLGAVSTKQAKRDRRAQQPGEEWGAGVDLGLLDRPVEDWRGVTERMDKRDRATLWSMARAHEQGIIVAKYGRRARGEVVVGALALRVRRTPAGSGDPLLTALQIEDRGAARRHRAGPDAPLLADKAVAVVGCGAVGSFLAEEIARSGVRRLTLVDDDRLRYGNCVRHLADVSFVYEHKTDAVKSILVSRWGLSSGSVVSIPKRLTPELAFDLIADHDLVIDATADSRAHDILGHLSEVVDQQWVKVALHRDGTVARVDRLGAGTAPRDRRPPEVTALSGSVEVRETGCGDPVSPTPPNVVRSTAALAFRVALDTLRPRLQRTYPDSVVEVLAANPAPEGDPYRAIGVITT